MTDNISNDLELLLVRFGEKDVGSRSWNSVYLYTFGLPV
jgi:hypothetical protein